MSEEAQIAMKELLAQLNEESRIAREATGIPEGYTRSQLLYLPVADTVIAEFYRDSDDVPEYRLFARRSTEIRYTAIGTPAEGISYQQPVALPQSACAYFSIWKTSACGIGQDWDSIQRLHLSDYRIEQVVGSGELVVAPPYESSWVSELLGVTEDGASLICKCGLMQPTDETGSKAGYFVCYLDLASKQVTPITMLKAVWY